MPRPSWKIAKIRKIIRKRRPSRSLKKAKKERKVEIKKKVRERKMVMHLVKRMAMLTVRRMLPNLMIRKKEMETRSPLIAIRKQL